MHTQQIPIIDAQLESIERQLADRDLGALAATLSALDAADLEPLFDRLGMRQRAIVFRLLSKDRALEVFEALQPSLQSDLLHGLQDSDVARLFAELDPDDRAWLVEEVPAALATRLLRGLPEADRLLTAALLGYPQGSAGRRMTPEYVSTRVDSTAAEALARVRARLDDAGTVYTMPVVDDARRLAGVVSLRDLLGAEADAPVSELMDADVPRVAPGVDQERAAHQLIAHGQSAIPVVGEDGRFVGLIPPVRMLEVLLLEHDEDMARIGGFTAGHRSARRAA